LLQEYGLDNGENIKKLLKAIIAFIKYFSPDFDFFKNYMIKLAKNFFIVGTNISKGISIFYNHVDYGDTKIVDAVRVSSSFPGVYTPVVYNNHHLIDGAVLEPYPLYYFDNEEEVIGILIKNNVPHSETTKEYKIDSLQSYYMSIINVLLDAYLEKCFDSKHKHTIYIDKELLEQNIMNFDLPKETKHSLVSIGKRAFDKYYGIITGQEQPDQEFEQSDQLPSDSNSQ